LSRQIEFLRRDSSETSEKRGRHGAAIKHITHDVSPVYPSAWREVLGSKNGIVMAL
jgi:hypothetical protein